MNMTKTQNAKRFKKNINNCTLILLTTVLIIISMFTSCSIGGNSDEDKIAEAVVIAQDIVEENLKVPSSADFPASFDDYNIYSSGNKYTVSFYFEAENSFGAKLRQKAVVTYTRTGSYEYKYSKADVYIGD